MESNRFHYTRCNVLRLWGACFQRVVRAKDGVFRSPTAAIGGAGNLLRTHLATLAVLFASFGTGAAAQPPVEVMSCFACHGQAAPAPYAGMPTIHGMPKIVIEEALMEFRQRSRPCTLTACSENGECPAGDMCEVVLQLDDEVIETVAEWFSEQRWVAANDPFDPGKAAIGATIHAQKCEVCHREGGAAPMGNAPRLRGQRAAYLRKALSDFQGGRRAAVAIVDGRVTGWRPSMDDLSEEDAEALVHFYSSPLEVDE